MSAPAYRLLDRQSEIAAFLDDLRGASSMAVDLEADSLHNYREQVCLVQISTTRENVILDPFAGPEVLDHLAPLLAEPGVRKILHGGDYDVRLLRQGRDLRICNLFDTMIAAQLTGRERFGLAALLEEHFGVRLDKRFQRADWSRRPLGPEMLDYAAADTAHLHALAGRLTEELSALRRLDWAEEEFRLLEQVEPAPPKRPSCLDFKGAGRLAPRQLARLQALLEVRDDVARERNRPPFTVLSNQTLLEWVLSPPAGRPALVSSPGASRQLLESVADRVLEALARAGALPDAECPQPVRRSRTVLLPAQESRLARLRAVREEASRTLRLAPGLIVNGATLERLACAEPAEARAALPDLLKRWQLEVLGDGLGAVLTQ